MAQKREAAVFIFNGFLESGKTVMIRRFLENPRICDGKKILLVLCEEGIEEYDEADLTQKNVTLVSIEAEGDYTAATFEAWEGEHRPDIIVVEYNGMWRGALPVETRYPMGWQIAEVMTTVDSSTFDGYVKNLRSLMVEQYKISDIVIFNRFTDEMDKLTCRNVAKAANMSIQVVFEYEDGRIDTEFDASPFDLTADEVSVSDGDFGVWYFDIMDHPDRYENKRVTLRAMCAKLNMGRMPGFLIGRFAMTCCADDIQFLGVYVVNDMKFKNRAWYEITAEVVSVDATVYGEEPGGVLPALKVVSLTPAKAPEKELVTF